MLSLFKNKFDKELKLISKEVQCIIIDKYNSHTIMSEGILDGEDIIKEYLEYNERGLAFEHLFYQISAFELDLSEELLKKIYRLGLRLNISKETIDHEIKV